MHLKNGWTRHALIVGSVAIKFPRLGIAHAVSRLLQLGQEGKVSAQLRGYDANVFVGLLRYVWRGVLANRVEYQFSKQYPPHSPWGTEIFGLMPTLTSFFGLVNIQPRGEPLTECQWSALHQQLQGTCMLQDPTFSKPENYCVYRGRVCLLDYGDLDSTQTLRQFLNETTL